MKKIASIMVSLVLIVLIVGCGVKKDTIKPTTEQPVPSPDVGTTIDKDLEQIDTDLVDTSDIDSGLEDIDQDLETI